MKTLTLIVALGCLPMFGCAAIITGTRSDVVITSTPSGAEVTIQNTNQRIRTPGVVSLKSNKDYLATFEAPCHTPATAMISKSISAWVIGDFFWGLLAFAIDFGSGGAYVLPDEVHGTLFRAHGCSEGVNE